MKKIEAIINPSEMEEIKKALTKIGIRRMTISKVGGFESQGGHKELYRADEYMIDVAKEFKIELFVTSDEMLSQVIETIKKTIKTESIGDEEIFVSSVEKVIRVRTGEHGWDAI